MRFDDLLDATAEAVTSRGPNCAADDHCPTLPRCQLCPGSPTYWRNPRKIDEAQESS